MSNLPLGTLVLPKVRLSFPRLFQPDDFNGNSAYQATFLIAKDRDDFEQVHNHIIDTIKAVAKEAWGDKAPQVLRELHDQGRVCYVDGDKYKPEYYAGYWVLRSRRKADQGMPVLLDNVRDGMDWRKLDPECDANRLYGGCYVNAMVRLWAQGADGRPNPYGKRINAALEAVQFHSDGAPFGSQITQEALRQAFTEDLVPEANAFASSDDGPVYGDDDDDVPF